MYDVQFRRTSLLGNIAFDSTRLNKKSKISKVARLDEYIDNLVALLRNFEEVSMFLQSDSLEVNFFLMRLVFDGLILLLFMKQ